MSQDQSKVLVDQGFIREAIVNEAIRRGLWQPGRPVFCRIETGIDASQLPPLTRAGVLAICESLDGDRIPIAFHAELIPMFNAEELTC